MAGASHKSGSAGITDLGDSVATLNCRWASQLKTTIAWALEPLALAEDDRVLEVPCCSGELIDRVFNRWPTVEIIGVDASLPRLAQAMQKNFGSGVYLLQAAIDRLPLESGTVDAVVCTAALHRLSQPAAVLAEIHRVLKPGGPLLLMDWCHDYPLQKGREWGRRLTLQDLVGVHSAKGSTRLIAQAGFTVKLADQARISWRWAMMRFLCRRK